MNVPSSDRGPDRAAGAEAEPADRRSPEGSLDPRLTLRQLDLFVAAADHGGFTAAAHALHLSPNSVSLAVSELERIFGARLVVRRRARGVTLTPAGRQLLDGARRLLRGAVDLRLSIGAGADELRGPVAVGCYTTLAPTVVPVLWSAMSEQHPLVELSVREGTGDELAEAVRTGHLDVLIAYEVALPAQLQSLRLYEAPPLAALAGDHRLAGAEPVEPAELAEEPLILFDQPPSGQNTLALLHRHGIRPRIGHRTADFELMRSLVGRGFGYGIQYQQAAVPLSREGRSVVTRPLVTQAPPEPVVVAWAQGLEPTTRARAVIEAARRCLGG